MRLIALELQGFKSFPDKTRLEFDDGVTAVVGPNGSGKSNIADAMRWVLGEQSTKNLRGAKMEDVIFNGTQERKPVGYAIVSMIIDNSERKLPDLGEEVTIARKLYRSGESEYSIDGEPVRMRDVHELFMDTGLGRDGYSIIGQGKIAEIVSAKGSERREIFEEAAGIAKFRYRRTDAERRLAAADENLVRLVDILSELEDRVGPLKEQSKKAKQFLELAGERKILEISLWNLQLDDLKQKLATQENKVLIAKNDYKNLEATSEQMEEKLSETYQRMQELSIAADERRNLIRSLEERQSKEKSQVAVLENDIHHNQETAKRITEELLGADNNEQEVLERQQQKAKELGQAREKVTKLTQELEEMAALYTEQEEKRNTLVQELEQLQIKKSSLEAGTSELRLEQATSSTRVLEGKSRLVDLEKNSTAYDLSVLEYQSNVEECSLQLEEQQKKADTLEEEKERKIALKSKILDKLVKIQKEYTELADEVNQRRSRVKLLQDLEANMEGFAGSVRFVVRQQESGKLKGICGTVSSLISTEKEYTTAIETALGGGMQNIVVEDEASAKEAMNALKASRAGRATFLPLTTIKATSYDFSRVANNAGFIGSADSLVEADDKFKAVIAQLLGRVCIVDTLDNATIIARANGYRFRIVTLDGQVINAGGSYTGGSTARSAGVLGRKVEIDRLVQEGKDLRKKADSLEPEIRKITDEQETTQLQIAELELQLRTEQEERTRLGFSLEQLSRNLSHAEENRALAKQELENLQEKIFQLQQGATSSASIIEESLRELAEADSTMVAKNIALQQQNIIIEEARTYLADKRMEEFAGEKEKESLLAELERVNEQATFANTNKDRLRLQKEELEEKNNQIIKEIEALKESVEHISFEVEANSKSITELMEQRTSLEQGTTELRKRERELSGKREDVSRELVRLEERTHAVQSQYDGIIAKLWDEYELTRSQALEQAEKLEDSEKSQRRLAELRTKIRGLGTVNVDAIEEYQEVSERFTFLSEQVNDVQSAKAQLLELIAELTEEMQILFLDTFHQINDEFSLTFRELFGGGKGQLLLTDNEDVLEAGIEIHVQPPGKVIKNLSLLSGGEQAFVAIAIYFAILKVNPAPFVLLDEIEAALDDVNVTRFAVYLKRMSKNTQFIAITHRRGTMEEADVLYGVTMQEEGVSKLLELNVNEVESKLGLEAAE